MMGNNGSSVSTNPQTVTAAGVRKACRAVMTRLSTFLTTSERMSVIDVFDTALCPLIRSLCHLPAFHDVFLNNLLKYMFATSDPFAVNLCV